MDYKYICYGCGKAKPTWSMNYLGLCLLCKIKKFFTGVHPNKLGKELAREIFRKNGKKSSV